MKPQLQPDRVHDQLTRDIISCRLAPGAKLRINELAETFDVSLGAVREALSRLAADGLVVPEAQKGYTVAPVSKDELLDLTQTRISIEARCIEESISAGDVDWESRIVAAAHRLNRVPRHDPQNASLLNTAWSTAHVEFHEALVAGCRSPLLLRIRGMLYAMSERYRHLSVPLENVERDVAGEHHAIEQAVLRRDVKRAVELMGAHVWNTTELLLKGLPADGTLPSVDSGKKAEQASRKPQPKRMVVVAPPKRARKAA